MADDNDLNMIFTCAVRYALGRMTYMPEVVTRYIMAHGDIVSKSFCSVALRDIENQRGMFVGLGQPCDIETWERFETWLKAKLEADAE